MWGIPTTNPAEHEAASTMRTLAATTKQNKTRAKTCSGMIESIFQLIGFNWAARNSKSSGVLDELAVAGWAEEENK